VRDTDHWWNSAEESSIDLPWFLVAEILLNPAPRHAFEQEVELAVQAALILQTAI